MSCVVKGCQESTGKKAILCSQHWNKIPKNLQEDLRRGTEKGGHTLRAHPSREWLGAISKHVGDVKNLVVKADYHTKQVTRKLQEKPDEVVPSEVV